MTIPAALARFYLCGRDDAEEDFDGKDPLWKTKELAQKLLDKGGADLADVIGPAVHRYLDHDDIDGTESVEAWEEQYAEELGAVGDHQDRARDLWRAGYSDETMYLLEDEVIDRLTELCDEGADEEPPARGTSKTKGLHGGATGEYGPYANDGTKDAVSSWDASAMEEYVEATVEAANQAVNKDQKGAIREASKAQAERYQAAAEEDGAKEEWIEQAEDDLDDDGLDPEIAYTQYWRPAFVAKTAKMIEERAREQLDER